MATAHNNKIATATKADWTFIDNEEVMLAAKYAARRAAREFEAVEFDDAEHDALLWLAVHPEIIKQYDLATEDGQKLMSYRIYSDALRERAIRESNQRNVTVYSDAENAAELGVIA